MACDGRLRRAELGERVTERFWHIGPHNQLPWPRQVFPRAPGPFIRLARDATGYERELVVGQWGLIPWLRQLMRLTPVEMFDAEPITTPG